MKTLFIPAKIKSKPNKAKISGISKELPKEIAIAYSIQYQDVAEEIKKILSKDHKITKLTQVLGCSKPSFPKNTKAVLLISSGKFHAVSLAIESNLPVYILEQSKLIKISKQDIESLEKKQKASYLKFLHADKVGILVSTKQGQQNLKKAIDFKKKSKKKSYIFLSNNIDANEFENFGLNSWVNTACSRMDMNNSSIINIERIK
jgi:2-(3-amino-3-carboxypropyl)histidine synthase